MNNKEEEEILAEIQRFAKLDKAKQDRQMIKLKKQVRKENKMTNQQVTRMSNERCVLDYLFESFPENLTFNTLVDDIGFAKITVSKILKTLVNDKLVVREADKTLPDGNPKYKHTFYRLNENLTEDEFFGISPETLLVKHAKPFAFSYFIRLRRYRNKS